MHFPRGQASNSQQQVDNGSCDARPPLEGERGEAQEKKRKQIQQDGSEGDNLSP